LIVIEPYAGYGTRRKALVRGRVLEDERIRPSAAGDRRWRNFAAFIRRMESDEVPFARLVISGTTCTADREGYFRA
jgi:phosphatidate phosphatase APP1